MGFLTGWVGKIVGRASPCVLVAVLFLCGCGLAGEARPERAFDAPYGVFIGMRGGEALRDERVLRTRVLVVDPAYFEEREIASLKSSGHTVYGYLNVGSLEVFRPYYGRFRKFVLGRYENWDEEWWVDVSAAPWRDFVVSELAAEYVRKGIDGFFVDNCDVYHYKKSRGIFDGLTEVLRRLSGAGLEVLSDDLGRRAVVLDEQVRLLSESSADRSGSEATEDEKRLIDQVAKTYQDMSARNAAQIVEQLREGLAVDLLKKLPVDARASILGKMKPQRAARLTELMSGQGR